ncbi:MAG: winged helix-turn-helix domain-containing protein, partial [Psychrosphaera sp.]|nr:winged helix-turn-helix domain-containing protein [Psychrosphaera sp.]
NRIATLSSKPHLAQVFNSPAGKVSVNALHHLASGISRVYVAFAQMVQHDPLIEFDAVMLRILDHLSPTYQTRLKHLSPQQRKLIASLSRKSGTTPVVEIAKYNRMTQQTASGQLKKLRDSGDVKSTAVGRTSHYEIATPLMRLALVLEQPQTKPVHHLLSFLGHWFASREQGLLTQDGQCFVFDKHWLHQINRPTSLPLNIRIQHHINSYLEALVAGTPCQFMMLREKIVEVARLLHAEQDETMRLDHINLLYGLACHNLINDNNNHALGWCHDLYDFAQTAACTTLWKHIAQLTVNLTAMFAVAGRVIDTQPMLSQLEKLETGLHNLPFSIALSHCLIAKAKGYTLINDKAKTQQTLEQMRMRADKRNNPQIAGAYAHAVKATLTYVAAHDKRLALKLFKHVEDISNKYHHTELLFSCARALWTALPEALTFARIVQLTAQVNTLSTFNHEICLLLRELAQKPAHEQAANHDLLWQKMVTLGCESVFAAGWVQVGLYLATQAPQNYHSWFNGCLPLMDRETSLQHSRNVLMAVQAYLDHEQDPHQLLVLPQEERVLVLAALGG